MSVFSIDVVGMVIKATLVLAVAALADVALRARGSAAVRHFVWTIAVTALLALPVASLALPRWSIAVPVTSPVSAAPAAGQTPPRVTERAIAAPAPAPAPATGAQGTAVALPAAAHRHFDPLAFTFALYSAGVVLLLARWIGGQLGLLRVARQSRSLVARNWLALVDGARRQMGIERRVRLLEADEDVMPFTFGTRRPTIVVPAASATWSDERRRAVIVHELAHVARTDCLAQHLAAFACALYWPHPGVWWASRRLRIEREHACDDRVLAMGTAPREYADHLLEIAHAFRATPAPATALGMARASQLEHRLLAVIDARRNRAALRRGGQAAAAIASAVLLLPVASLHADVVHRQATDLAAAEAGSRVTSVMSGTSAASAMTGAAAQRRDRSTDRFTTDDYSGTWELRPSRQRGMVQVNLRTAHSSYGRTLPLSRFEGLNDSGSSAAIRDGHIVDGTVHFASRRDAGTFTFDGVCRNQMCGGTYTFAPDAAFASRLAQYGIGTPTASQQYELAMADVGVDYLEGLKTQGYAVPDVQTLVRAAEHGVSLEYVKAMASLGYKLGTLEPLIRMRDHGVDPEYVRGMADAGFTSLTADQLVRTRDHGVDPQYVQGMRDAGLMSSSATLDDLIKTRDHGVDPAFARSMSAAGYRSLSLQDLIRARDHGADPQFASGLAALGYKSLPLDTLISARDHGIDPEYVDGLAQAGYKHLPLDELIRARNHGVDAEYAHGMAAVGYKDLPIDSLIRMRDHGVDADYVRRLQQRGVEHLTVDDLIRLRDHGEVDPASAARAALAAFRSYYRSLLTSLRTYRL